MRGPRDDDDDHERSMLAEANTCRPPPRASGSHTSHRRFPVRGTHPPYSHAAPPAAPGLSPRVPRPAHDDGMTNARTSNGRAQHVAGSKPAAAWKPRARACWFEVGGWCARRSVRMLCTHTRGAGTYAMDAPNEFKCPDDGASACETRIAESGSAFFCGLRAHKRLVDACMSGDGDRSLLS